VLRPFLFVGVGGSGGDTLRHLHRELNHRLHRAGLSEMPTGWQFLHIDTRTTEEYNDLLPRLPDSSYIGLVTRGLRYRTIASTILNQDWGPVRASCAGWLPDPDQVHVAIEEGAGQYRALGRAAAIGRLKLIRSKLDEAVLRVQQAEAKSSLDQLAVGLGMQPDGSAPSPIVVVFSSLAGGTGSGLFLDVCDLLRGTDRTWAEDSVAVLYAPDVFKDLREDQRRGVQANALATVSELLAGYWRADPGPDPVHRAAGAVFSDLQRSGPGHAFLVGTNNDHLSFHQQQDVFAVVARTVAAWATSPAIQKQFSSYVQSNWQQGAGRPDPLQLVTGGLDMPFSALGYASVGLGRDLFRRYVAQSLGRACAERLLHGAGGAPTGGRPPADPTEVVGRRRAGFAAGMLGLAATGARPAARDLFERLSEGRRQALDAEQESIRYVVGTGDRELDEWRRILRAVITERRAEFLDQQYRTAFLPRVKGWVDEVQAAVRAEITSSLAADGLVVTARLVTTMIDDLNRIEIPALEAGAMTDSDVATTFVKELNGSLGQSPGKRLLRSTPLFPPSHPRVVNGLASGVETAMGRALDARVRQVCAELLRDYVENLLAPLSAALSSALYALQKDATSGVEGRPSLISQWPAGPSYPVPVALRPVRTHYVIDYVDDYPPVFKELMVRSVPDVKMFGDAVNRAIGLILRAGELAGVSRPVLEQSASWQPRKAREWSDLLVERAAAYRLGVSGRDLEDRCDAWAGQAPELGAYLGQKLGDALGGEQPDLAQQGRLDRYTEQFEKAVNASAPLVGLDSAYTSQHLEDSEAAYQTLISQIPLEPGSVAYDISRRLLLRLTNLTPDNVDNQFDARGSGEIEFTTFLNAPCHPVGFLSLTKPIKSDWQEKQGDLERRAMFAKWRRARSLPRATPLPQASRRRLVRGWLIAFALAGGEVDLDRRGQELVVRPREAMEPLAFPLLGEPPAVDDALDTAAAVVESLPLVLIEPVSSDAPALRAYRTLLKLADGLDTLLTRVDGFVDELAALVAKLIKESGDRLPEDAPPAADRVWELRADFHFALRELARELGIAGG
jgi:hypothetical protein